MSLSLPAPRPTYDANNEAQTRAILERNDAQIQRKTQDIIVKNRNLVLISPDGTQYALTVANDGTVSGTAL